MYRYNWFIVRIITILILASLYYDLEIILFFIGFIYLHFKNGLIIIIIDYIHDLKLSIIFNNIIKIILIENIRYILEIFY